MNICHFERSEAKSRNLKLPFSKPMIGDVSASLDMTGSIGLPLL
jgi:hypothetical protein